MEHLWIVASILAAFFQAIRLAALKELNRHLSTLVATYVRILFGLPFMLLYLVAVLQVTGEPLPKMGWKFILISALVSLGQFLGTALIVRLFQLGNFAVGIMLAKVDVIVTAVIGSLLFSEVITGGGWLAILVTVAGMMLASAGRLPAGAWSNGTSIRAVALGASTRIGLLIGLINAVSYLALREAILVLDPAAGPTVRSALSATMMLVIGTILVGGWLWLTEREGLWNIFQYKRLAMFAGLTSAIGTLFWFLASALTNAAYVAAVAQVQIVFALVISHYWFKEAIRPLELAGIGAILTGIMLFRFV